MMGRKEFMDAIEASAEKLGVRAESMDGLITVGSAVIHCLNDSFAIWYGSVDLGVNYVNVDCVAGSGDQICIVVEHLPYLFLGVKGGSK
jgi:hypothetical protein